MTHAVKVKQPPAGSLRLTAFKTDKEIAFALGLSGTTVKKQVHAACQRLGANRRKAALALRERNGPGGTNDPMAGFAPPGSTVSPQPETRRDPTDDTPAALDLGRSESALGPFGQSGPLNLLRSHLLDGLRADAESTPTPELLKQALSAGWGLEQAKNRVGHRRP